MRLTITYFGGRQEIYGSVRYTSIYPSDSPHLMRVEFTDNAPSVTIDLTAVSNITVIG